MPFLETEARLIETGQSATPGRPHAIAVAVGTSLPEGDIRQLYREEGACIVVTCGALKGRAYGLALDKTLIALSRLFSEIEDEDEAMADCVPVVLAEAFGRPVANEDVFQVISSDAADFLDGLCLMDGATIRAKKALRNLAGQLGESWDHGFDAYINSRGYITLI